MTRNPMSQEGASRNLRAVWFPAAAVLGVMVASKILYNLPWPDFALTLHKPATFHFGITLNLAIAFGPSVIYPLGRFRGVLPRACILASLLTPVIWIIWETINFSACFSLGESLYYSLNPLFLTTLTFMALQMGLWETVYRFRRRKTEGLALVVRPVLAVLVSLGLFYVFALWEMGQNWFYFYQSGYKALFS
ncbi:MAG: hypothetical protein JEZ02_11150 [Desulfatibacillum sp.]|nr:hypothetical protein [Desulfatibacillum sp.]